MRQAKRKEKDKVAIVLMLCFCVIALTSIFTIKSNIDKVKENGQQVLVSDETAAEQSADEADASSSKEDSSDDAEELSLNSDDDSGSQTAADTSDQSSQEASSSSIVDSLDSNSSDNASRIYIYPVSSADCFITNPFSMDSLIYSLTLDQYMVHCGTDIQAEEGTNVLTMDDGIVTAVYVDDRYGNSVEVTHSGNLVSIYSNLSDSKMVEVGDSLAAGDVVGTVGTTGLFENLEPAHLHMEVLKDGTYVNPEDYICNNQ